MTVLKPDSARPFSGGWCDWHAPEGNVGLTFETTVEALKETWRTQCVYGVPADHDEGIETPRGTRVDHSLFDPEALYPPGIHKEVDEDDYEYYQAVIAREYLHHEFCEDWIDRLNEVHDRNLELSYDLDS